jgi:hypothetical protein
MNRARTVTDVEADLTALRAAAERAGTALACLFSSSDEFEADVIRERRAQGALPSPRRFSAAWFRSLTATALLAAAFLMI